MISTGYNWEGGCNVIQYKNNKPCHDYTIFCSKCMEYKNILDFNMILLIEKHDYLDKYCPLFRDILTREICRIKESYPGRYMTVVISIYNIIIMKTKYIFQNISFVYDDSRTSGAFHSAERKYMISEITFNKFSYYLKILFVNDMMKNTDSVFRIIGIDMIRQILNYIDY